jgi:hypothetical protein
LKREGWGKILPEKYLWVNETAKKWGISKSWVYRLCRMGRIKGAYFRNGRWSIPENAKKPDPTPSKRMLMLKSKQIELPQRLLLRLSGDGESIPASFERLFSECAGYIMDFVDLSPQSGRALFCALSYPHVKAVAFCNDPIEYAFFTVLKEQPKELYSRLSMMLFELAARQPSERKEYYRSVKEAYAEFAEKEELFGLAACALFLCMTSSGGELSISSDGLPDCEMRRRGYIEEPELDDILRYSELLARAEIVKAYGEDRAEICIPEFSTVHVSPRLDEDGRFSEITRHCERVLIL